MSAPPSVDAESIVFAVYLQNRKQGVYKANIDLGEPPKVVYIHVGAIKYADRVDYVRIVR